jgi:hypothetical protein
MNKHDREAAIERSLDRIHEFDVERASNTLDRWDYLSDPDTLISRRGAVSGLLVA